MANDDVPEWINGTVRNPVNTLEEARRVMRDRQPIGRMLDLPRFIFQDATAPTWPDLLDVGAKLPEMETAPPRPPIKPFLQDVLYIAVGGASVFTAIGFIVVRLF